MNICALLPTLDPVAVEAQKLNVVTFASEDFLVEGDPILAGTLLGSTTEDVINVQNSLVSDSAVSARTSESLNGCVSRRSVLVVSASPAEFSYALGMGSLPLVYLGLLCKIVALGAYTSLLDGWMLATANTGFYSHTRNLSSGKRVEKML